MTIISCKNLCKKFNAKNTSKAIIKDIDIKIKKGEFISIMGPSGAGKSTLLYLLSGLEKPTSGEVIFKNNDICKLSDNDLSKLRRDKFGFVFQFYNLVPTLNVYENIALPLELNNIKQKNYKQKIINICERVGISGKLKSFPYELSGGEQQRVAIARALAIEPEIIFADEPTGNLDSKTGFEILELFKRLNKENNMTIVMVTHDHKATEFSTRLIRIRDGNIEDSID